jgi:DNA-binding CsgD family transcriptional regulator
MDGIAQPPPLGGHLEEALAQINLPAYVLDHSGLIRWMNERAIELFGDHRGAHYLAPVAPEGASASRLAFTKKRLGSARTTDYESVLRLRSGEQVSVEIHAVSIENGGRFIGIFGIVAVDEERAVRRTFPAALTPRQSEVLRLLARGHSTGQMAESLGLSRETIRNHVRGLLHALHVNSRVEALAEARRRGLLG